MVDLDRTEEEQVEALKEWFKKNGSAIIFGLAIGLAAIGGYRFWQDYTVSQAQKASLAYGAYQNKLIASESAAIFDLGEKIINQYPDTPYAALAALGMAKVSVDNDSLESAEVHLNWVIENGSQEGLVDIARLRLVRVLMAQEKYDQALALISTPADSGFTSLYKEIHGDILLAQGEEAQALQAYQTALDTADTNDPRRQLISMKINELPVVN